jgi:hypothetical protein
MNVVDLHYPSSEWKTYVRECEGHWVINTVVPGGGEILCIAVAHEGNAAENEQRFLVRGGEEGVSNWSVPGRIWSNMVFYGSDIYRELHLYQSTMDRRPLRCYDAPPIHLKLFLCGKIETKFAKNEYIFPRKKLPRPAKCSGK